MKFEFVVVGGLLLTGLFGQSGGGGGGGSGGGGQQPPPVTTFQMEHKGKLLTVTIAGSDVAPKQGYTAALVSGTSVEFSVQAGAGQIEMHQWQFEDWSVVRVKEFEVKILGEQIANPPGPPELPTPWSPDSDYSYNVRFASTHFDDDTSGKIRLRAVFEGMWWLEGGIPQTSEKELIVEVSIKVYNKAGLVATAVPPGSDAALKAKQCINISGAALEGMNHSVEPKPFDDAQSVTLSQLIELIRKSTVFVAVTHGDQRGIYPSNGMQPQLLEPTWPTIANWVHDPDPSNAPPYNLVVMMACDTTGRDNGKTPSAAFGIANVVLGPGGSIASGSKNRAYIGWNFPLWAEGPPTTLNPGDITDLAIWAEKFFAGLAAGKSVGDVVGELNRLGIVPRTGQAGSLWSAYPRIVGDKNMKLVGVYGVTGMQWVLVNPPDAGGGAPGNRSGGNQ
jgi:hypothetical protein